MPDRSRDARRGRRAVAGLFAVNGFLMGSWAPQIPLLLPRLSISETIVGLLIFGFGVGAVAAMPWSGRLIARHGSRRVTGWFGPVAALALAGVVLAPGVWAAALALAVFGAGIGGMDVAMNANAVEVERRLDRAVMSSSHGFWSLGGFLGGATGGPAIAAFGATGHATAVSILSLVALLAALAFAVADAPHEDDAASRPRGLPRDPLIWLIGLMALFSMVPEGAVLDWSALYLGKELGAPLQTAGLAFAAFSGAMALMRFTGDMLRDRFGAVATLRWSAIVAAAGLALGGLATAPLVAIAAFAVAGLGMANTVPIAFSAGGNHPGLVRGAGLAVVTTTGYAGILVAPSLIGRIGENTGFSPVYLGVAAMMGVVAALAGLAKAADRARDHAAA